MEVEQKILGTGWIRVRERVKDEAQVVSLILFGGKVSRSGQIRKRAGLGS